MPNLHRTALFAATITIGVPTVLALYFGVALPVALAREFAGKVRR